MATIITKTTRFVARRIPFACVDAATSGAPTASLFVASLTEARSYRVASRTSRAHAIQRLERGELRARELLRRLVTTHAPEHVEQAEQRRRGEHEPDRRRLHLVATFRERVRRRRLVDDLG